MTHTISSFTRRTILMFTVLLCTASAQAQITRYIGTWVTAKDIKVADENTNGVVAIDAKGTTWNIFNNQLLLDFNNRVKDDTLLLLYQSCECSKPLKTSYIRYPKSNSVVAKLYRRSDKELGVKYESAAFIASVRKYMVGAKADKEAIFPAVLYFNSATPAMKALK